MTSKRDYFFVADLREITSARKGGHVNCHKMYQPAHSISIKFAAASRGFLATARVVCNHFHGYNKKCTGYKHNITS